MRTGYLLVLTATATNDTMQERQPVMQLPCHQRLLARSTETLIETDEVAMKRYAKLPKIIAEKRERTISNLTTKTKELRKAKEAVQELAKELQEYSKTVMEEACSAKEREGELAEAFR